MLTCHCHICRFLMHWRIMGPTPCDSPRNLCRFGVSEFIAKKLSLSRLGVYKRADLVTRVRAGSGRAEKGPYTTRQLSENTSFQSCDVGP